LFAVRSRTLREGSDHRDSIIRRIEVWSYTVVAMCARLANGDTITQGTRNPRRPSWFPAAASAVGMGAVGGGTWS
jgi:hypothetical protein